MHHTNNINFSGSESIRNSTADCYFQTNNSVYMSEEDNANEEILHTRYKNDEATELTYPISTQDLLIWALQVARGMDYISQKKVNT